MDFFIAYRLVKIRVMFQHGARAVFSSGFGWQNIRPLNILYCLIFHILILTCATSKGMYFSIA